jgi:hypothetical protein
LGQKDVHLGATGYRGHVFQEEVPPVEICVHVLADAVSQVVKSVLGAGSTRCDELGKVQE